MQKHVFQQLKNVAPQITEPTRVTENTETLIEWFMTNAPEKVSSSAVLHIGISDHSLIYWCRKIALKKSYPKIVETRNFKNYSPFAFNSDLYESLSQFNWSMGELNKMQKQFENAFNQTIEIHAPIHRKVRSSYAPWLDVESRKAMLNRDYLKKRTVQTNSKTFHNAYKRSRNYVNKLIKNSKN